MAEKTCYWCSTQKNFGRDIGFGDKIELDKDRFDDLFAKGLVSEKKPESITDAQLNSIDDLKKANAGLAAKVKELESQIAELTKPKGKK